MSWARVFVVITAAGQSRRMGGTDKLTLTLQGRPLLAQTAQPFLRWPKLTAMAVAVSPGREDELREILTAHCPENAGQVHVLTGGRERQDSIRLALELLQDRYRPQASDAVLIHDAARPFVDASLFDALLVALSSCDGAIPATPVRDTVKRVSGASVLHTEDRETLRLVQTPQAFRFATIVDFHRRANKEDFLGTDDASLVENYGGKVQWIPGPAHNLKVTVPEDIDLLNELASRARTVEGQSS